MKGWLTIFLLLVVLLFTGCDPKSQKLDAQPDLSFENNLSQSNEYLDNSKLVSCCSSLEYYQEVNLGLIKDRNLWKEKFEEVSNKFSTLQGITSFEKTPTKTSSGYDYAYCGEKFVGDKSDCSFKLYCTFSMSPLFNCQEKLLFTTHKNRIEIGDIVDIRLPKPEIVKGNAITNQIHIIRRINNDGSYLTGSLNVALKDSTYATDEETYYVVDEFRPTKQDIKGVLKGMTW